MEPISVLIVEDERILLDDILHMIDWESNGFQIVSTAANGRLGIFAWQSSEPDLIITDIRMPVMDGLSMMREIRQTDTAVSFLILSSYSEFEYAREAVRLGTDSYCLKADLSPELLLETLLPIRDKLSSRRAMGELTARHELFALLSASVEPNSTSSPSAVAAAFRAYLKHTRDRSACKKQLQWILKECYGALSVTDQSAPCDADDPDEMEGWLLREYDRLRNYHSFVFEKRFSPVIINASDYIKTHYSDSQLKISTVAEFVGLSASRLSVLFKQETGQTVNDYITQVRIDEAKQLLRSGRYKVYEVADIVGYKTSQYFSQIFCQHTGCSPTEYLRGHGQ